MTLRQNFVGREYGGHRKNIVYVCGGRQKFAKLLVYLCEGSHETEKHPPITSGSPVNAWSDVYGRQSGMRAVLGVHPMTVHTLNTGRSC